MKPLELLYIVLLQVADLQGTFLTDYPASRQADKAWQLFENLFANQKTTATFGALDPVQVHWIMHISSFIFQKCLAEHGVLQLMSLLILLLIRHMLAHQSLYFACLWTQIINIADHWHVRMLWQIVTFYWYPDAHELTRRSSQTKWQEADFLFGAVHFQVVQMAKYLQTIYVSGWQSSSTASTSNEPGPDIADYPMDTVPRKVRVPGRCTRVLSVEGTQQIRIIPTDYAAASGVQCWFWKSNKVIL